MHPAYSLNWFDAAMGALLLLFAWRGYRRGLLSWLAGLGASLLAFALAFALAPTVTAAFAPHAGLAKGLSERFAFIALLLGLRLVMGWAAHELVASLRPLLRALPPLALVDHLLGVVPSLLMGLLVVALLLIAALVLPVDRRLHQGAADSLIGHTLELQVERAAQRLPELGLPVDPAQLTAALRGTLRPT